MTRAFGREREKKGFSVCGWSYHWRKTSLLSGMCMYMNVAETAAASHNNRLCWIISLVWIWKHWLKPWQLKQRCFTHPNAEAGLPVLECQVSLISRAPSPESCDCAESQLCVRSWERRPRETLLRSLGRSFHTCTYTASSGVDTVNKEDLYSSEHAQVGLHRVRGAKSLCVEHVCCRKQISSLQTNTLVLLVFPP